jgi:hypothetical protein
LSPKEPPVANSAHPSIDVKGDADGGEEEEDKKEAVRVKRSEVKDEDEEKKVVAPEAKMEATPTKAQVANSAAASSKNAGAGRRKSRKSIEPNGVSSASKPYLGLFAAALLKDSTPMVEITDLRPDVAGEKTWLEPIDCLVCGARVK